MNKKELKFILQEGEGFKIEFKRNFDNQRDIPAATRLSSSKSCGVGTLRAEGDES